MKSDVFAEALEDIRRNCELIIEFTDSIDRDRLEVEYKTHYTVIRALEIAGEATKPIPEPATA